jgi:hypothetical protein
MTEKVLICLGPTLRKEKPFPSFRTRFVDSVRLQPARDSKHKQEISAKGGQALKGTNVAYKKAGNAAKARWSRPPRTEK